MLGMQYKRQVEHPRLEGRVPGVPAQHVQDVLRRADLRVRPMDDEAVVEVLVHVCLEAVDRHQRHRGDHIEALAEQGRHRDVVGVDITRVQGEDTTRHGVHDVAARHPEQRVVDEVPRQVPSLGKLILETPQLLSVGQLPEEDQIGRLLESEPPLIEKAAHEVVDADTTIDELAWHRDVGVALRGGAHHITDLRETGKDALARDVPEAALHVVLRVLVRVHDTVVVSHSAPSLQHLLGGLASGWAGRLRNGFGHGVSS